MKFLINKCCAPRLGAALVATGHDAMWLREIEPGAPDTAMLAFATAQGRRLVPHVGIGGYVVRRGIELQGRIVIRTALGHLATLVEELCEKLLGSITVLADQGRRQRQLGQRTASHKQADD